MENVKNLFVNFEDGENCLVYTEDLSEDEVKRWAEKATGEKVSEVYHVPQEELQYYCIDGRVWALKPEKVAQIRSYIAS